MAVVDVLNTKNVAVSEIDLDDAVFGVPVRADILHQVVRMQMASHRSGTASVKNRSDVRGSTAKLFRQKGTGRARRGDIKAPLLRGGGVVFGPHPKSWSHKVPKKVRKTALRMALSAKLQDESIVVLDQFGLEQPKTKAFAEIMGNLDAPSALIVIDSDDANLDLASRNIQGVKVLRAEGLNVYDILKYDKLILLAPSIKAIEERFAS